VEDGNKHKRKLKKESSKMTPTHKELLSEFLQARAATQQKKLRNKRDDSSGGIDAAEQ
jgi:hypothetical protein